MASWYKDLLTNASSNITKLQRTYFGGESDGDTDDDTLVCRVLRGYYTEKGQPLPSWLPPDPKGPPPTPTAASQPAGGRYGSSGQGLSSLWDNTNSNAGNHARGAANSRNPFAAGRDDGMARPGLAQGQRAGSDKVSTAGVSAQEKLKQRLWGGARTASPTSGGGPFQPPAPQHPPSLSVGGGGRSGGGGGNSGNRWGWGSGSDGGARSGDRPVMSANAPWADGGFDYPGPGTGRSYGLPSGPKGKLPSGSGPTR